ncbi:MAG: DUF4249 domain-containing protein [Taibaiella sp.]|nr:DUF4249 domain-containing protein [Taibaiella sp.]
MNKLPIQILPFILLSIFGAFQSCMTKIVNPAMNVGDDKAFVQCYLNPDEDTITLALSVAKGTSSDGRKIDPGILPEASVILKNGSDRKLMHFHSWNNNLAIFYLEASELSVLPGNTYHLEVTYADLLHLESVTTVPDTDFDFEHTETGSGPDINGDLMYRFKATLRDDPGSDNYYRLTLEENEYHSVIHQEFISDDDNQNTHPTIQFYVDEYYYAEGTKVCVSSMNEDTYLFLSRIQYILDQSGNPFAEPSSLHSNIEGGLGIFGGWKMISKDLK